MVDDDQDIREWMGAVFLEAGYNVAFASDGAEALLELSRGHFDVVVTDIVMPNRDGFELIGALRESWPEIRIIVVSGDGRGAREGYLQTALGLGAHSALSKPFGVTKLRAAVVSVLNF